MADEPDTSGEMILSLTPPNVTIPAGMQSLDSSISARQYLSMRGEGRESSFLCGSENLAGALLNLSIGSFHIRDIWLWMKNGKSAILGSGTVVDGLIDSCWFNGNGTTGGLPLISSDLINVTITNSVFEMAAHAMKVPTYGEYIGISDCIFWDVRNTVMEFENCNGIILSNLFIEAKNIEDPTASAVVFKNCRNVVLSNLIFSKVGNAPVDSFAHAIHFENCIGMSTNNLITDGFASGEAIVTL